MVLRAQGIDNDNDGGDRVRRSCGLSDNDGGVGRRRGIEDTSEILETTTDAAGYRRRA